MAKQSTRCGCWIVPNYKNIKTQRGRKEVGIMSTPDRDNVLHTNQKMSKTRGQEKKIKTINQIAYIWTLQVTSTSNTAVWVGLSDASINLLPMTKCYSFIPFIIQYIKLCWSWEIQIIAQTIDCQEH